MRLIPPLPTWYPLFLPVLVLLLGATAASARAGDYADLIDFPHNEANWARFYDLQERLIADFDAICPDTFCEGEYSNYLLLQLRCSVHAPSASVAACALVLGAGELEVDTRTGELVDDSRTWGCAAPLAPGTSVEAFHAALAGPGALHARLPGSAQSLYEALFFCLSQRPAGRVS